MSQIQSSPQGSPDGSPNDSPYPRDDTEGLDDSPIYLDLTQGHYEHNRQLDIKLQQSIEQYRLYEVSDNNIADFVQDLGLRFFAIYKPVNTILGLHSKRQELIKKHGLTLQDLQSTTKDLSLLPFPKVTPLKVPSEVARNSVFVAMKFLGSLQSFRDKIPALSTNWINAELQGLKDKLESDHAKALEAKRLEYSEAFKRWDAKRKANSDATKASHQKEINTLHETYSKDLTNKKKDYEKSIARRVSELNAAHNEAIWTLREELEKDYNRQLEKQEKGKRKAVEDLEKEIQKQKGTHKTDLANRKQGYEDSVTRRTRRLAAEHEEAIRTMRQDLEKNYKGKLEKQERDKKKVVEDLEKEIQKEQETFQTDLLSRKQGYEDSIIRRTRKLKTDHEEAIRILKEELEKNYKGKLEKQEEDNKRIVNDLSKASKQKLATLRQVSESSQLEMKESNLEYVTQINNLKSADSKRLASLRKLQSEHRDCAQDLASVQKQYKESLFTLENIQSEYKDCMQDLASVQKQYKESSFTLKSIQ
ncbi:hypothetical protein NHQ30_007795 [Ciborinia camelliae]|nr:hypothetical protein NHQ30_007795 [Ciborinia camelliae]